LRFRFASASGTAPALVTRVGSKENQTGVGQAEKGTSAVGEKTFVVSFLPLSASDSKEIL
jgi:hypothetical protein